MRPASRARPQPERFCFAFALMLTLTKSKCDMPLELLALLSINPADIDDLMHDLHLAQWRDVEALVYDLHKRGHAVAFNRRGGSNGCSPIKSVWICARGIDAANRDAGAYVDSRDGKWN